ncbi:SUMF1/EgtB/PvdO family nonheme iron enzyme [Chitinophaga rhizophila]|uniref:SUMF1/EgtB/PvdO family nonheme iron enzyme n=1 Tax=Chitinophaga rhizophila TaxID=2866212 RepID=A0ABS7GA86_9BACT|nr:SUMF1/EgtB/PvdO family nonheme iron enzyme [Chitinophaga rhizophila]MBW8684351.1 SUMF1/EgtB/PvdO family nonheme iron enzyme [Chitinophaga rhizophila]
MNRRFKYDIVISVAEEDKQVADLIAAELKKIRVRYYYYVEEGISTWGVDIMRLTIDNYSKHARFVLMIVSETFDKKYWANIERLVAMAERRSGAPHILPLRLDNTPIDGLSKHIVYQVWKNNPAEIAAMLKEKIRRQIWEKQLKTIITTSAICGGLAFSLGAYNVFRPIVDPPPPPPEKYMQQRLVSAPGIDSFYISNTEVSVAQYRKYCDSTGKQFPPQTPNVSDNAPVSNVTWYEAVEFCKSRNGRLPTESEWQYAASAGLPVKYSGGSAAKRVAVYGAKKQAIIGTKAPNEFKLYDMTGNVAEWCADWSDTTNTCKIVKGGAYNSPVTALTNDSRMLANPDERQPTIGFRVAWDK